MALVLDWQNGLERKLENNLRNVIVTWLHVKTDQMDILSAVLYFNESCSTLIGIDEVVVDSKNHYLKFDFETTPVWSRLQQALKAYEMVLKCT